MKKTIYRAISGTVAAAALAMLMQLGSPAFAAEKDVAKTLQERVAKLSPEQQAALLAFLDQLPADKTTTAAETPETAMRESLREYEKTVADKSFNEAALNHFLERLSTDFQISGVGGKEDVRQWLVSMQSILAPGGVPAATFSLANTKFTVSGNTATASPIDVSTPIGSVTATVYAKLEDGKWRVTGADGY